MASSLRAGLRPRNRRRVPKPHHEAHDTVAESWWTKVAHVLWGEGSNFDSTLGFPGEGPRRQRVEQHQLKVGTVNSTHWSTFVKANLWGGEGGV